MRIVDLTQPVLNGMVVGAGMEIYRRNPARIEVIACHSPAHAERLQAKGCLVAEDADRNYVATASRLVLTSHTGTHIDAPSHFDEDGLTIDQVPLERCMGPAAVFDLRHVPDGQLITRKDLERVDPGVRSGDWIIIKTGWNDRVGTRVVDQYAGAPHLHRSVAEFVLEKGVVGLATDCFSDEPLSPDVDPREWAPIHRALLPSGILLLENLTNTLQIRQARVELHALPLFLLLTDGAPCRAIAIEE